MYALPLLSALTATHALIPTHPGPAAVARLLGADIGKMTLYGLVLAIPMTIVGGITYAGWVGRKITVAPPEHLLAQAAVNPRHRQPTVLLVLSVILLPILLIGLGAVFPGIAWIAFLGSVPVSLLISAVAAMFALGRYSGLTADEILRHTGESLNSVGALIMIVGASGALKQIIVDSGAGAFFGQLMLRVPLSPLLIAFLVGAALRIALGSATAAIVTAGGIVAPIATAFPAVDAALMAIAVTMGGSIFSHVNDAGFWMVKEYCGMDVKQTIQAYSVMKAVTSASGLFTLWLLSLLV